MFSYVIHLLNTIEYLDEIDVFKAFGLKTNKVCYQKSELRKIGNIVEES